MSVTIRGFRVRVVSVGRGWLCSARLVGVRSFGCRSGGRRTGRFRVEVGSFGGCGGVGWGGVVFGGEVVVETPVGAGCSEAGGGGVGSG